MASLPPPTGLTAGLTDEQNRYFDQYRKELERELFTLTDRALDKWLKDSDASVKDALNIALNALTKEVATALQASLGGISGGGSGLNLGANSAPAKQLASAIDQLITSTVTGLFERQRTTVSTQETERSRQADADFRLSRSQQQAQAAKNVSRGNRNL